MSDPTEVLHVDVLVIGGGNAGLCAAVAALDAGVDVMVLEKAPKSQRGGNTQYTAFYRFPYDGIEDLQSLCTFPPDVAERADIPAYTVEAFLNDLVETSGGRADVDWMSVLADDALDTMNWLSGHGVRWAVSMEGAREHEGRLKWQPGTVVRPSEGGTEILRALYSAVSSNGGEVAYETALTDLLFDEAGRVRGAVVKRKGGLVERIHADAVILAAGGFEASPEMRARYLGPGWDVAKVRGSRYNTGESLDIALRHGAATSGEWTGCHATMVHGIAPDVEMGEEALFPLAYPFGIILNQSGERFVDEGEHFYLHTYAKLGKAILGQPGQRAFQVFDSKSIALRRAVEGAGELAYAVPHHTSDSLEELATEIGIDPATMVRTIDEYNRAIQPGDFDPSLLDGKRTAGLTPEKTNWAVAIDTPPFEAYPVECGITFTYGGLKSNTDGAVLDLSGNPIDGLYVAGEMAGSFFTNYAGGSGLTKGAVYGRRAGRHAATIVSSVSMTV